MVASPVLEFPLKYEFSAAFFAAEFEVLGHPAPKSCPQGTVDAEVVVSATSLADTALTNSPSGCSRVAAESKIRSGTLCQLESAWVNLEDEGSREGV